MKTGDYEFVAQLVKERSGLVLQTGKEYLLESRLLPVARNNGMETLEQLVSAMRVATGEGLRVAVNEAMTTNESFFFRDKTPFELFKDVMLPPLLEARALKKTLRIWCAAASSGQEPYSLAMIIKDMPELANWRIDILGTDISNAILEKAKTGMYSQFEVQRGLPVNLLMKYFKQNGEFWQIDSSIRSMVTYRNFNLLDDFHTLGTFDVVFCRNVLIYFDSETKGKVMDKISQVMAPDGYMILGSAESVFGLSDKYSLVPDQKFLYTPKAESGGSATVSSFSSMSRIASSQNRF